MHTSSRCNFTALMSLVCAATVGCSEGDKGTGQSWSRLVEGSWSLDPGGELTRYCVRKKLTEDVYVSAIRPVHPPGTHHTVVTLGDETTDCTNNVFTGVIYAAGVGSEGLTMPPGVAMKLPAGKYVLLGLHVYNTSTQAISGTSAIEIQTIKPEDVKSESEAFLAGTFNISLPPQQTTTLKGDCPIAADQTMFALFPHMHQLGVHLKTTFTMGGVDKVIHDGDYSFQEQYQIPLNPTVTLHAGDKVTTECTYDNTTPNTVTFGESSDTEMCFSVLFRYPPQGQGICTGGAPTALNGPPCAAPGAPGNEVGVGQQCTASGNECTGASTFCLATFVTGTFGDFCTKSCQADADCGTGASCVGTAPRQICMPTSCLSSLTVGGTTDAGVSTDAGDGG